MVSGVASALLEGGAGAAMLNEINLTLDDVTGLVADANHLLDEIDDRDAKQAAAAAAVAAVHETDDEINQHTASIAFLLRGKLGAKAPALKDYGVLPLSTGGRRGKAAAKAPSTPAQTT